MLPKINQSLGLIFFLGWEFVVSYKILGKNESGDKLLVFLLLKAFLWRALMLPHCEEEPVSLLAGYVFSFPSEAAQI